MAFTKEETIMGAMSEAGAAALAVRQLVEDLHKQQSIINRIDDNGLPYRITAAGGVEIMERLADAPAWRRGSTQFHAAVSFCEFVNRFKNTTSVIFADVLHKEGPIFTGILDYHPAGEDPTGASWDTFRAHYQLRKTEQWLRWEAANKKEMGQVEFAQFLEDNIPDIAEPAGGIIVDMARTLEAKTDVKWKSQIRAQDGSRVFAFSETVDAATQDGTVKVPDVFVLHLAPFEGTSPQMIAARLRFRVGGGSIKLWFELQRFDEVVRKAFVDELEKIDSMVTGEEGQVTVPIFRGPAPIPQTPLGGN